MSRFDTHNLSYSRFRDTVIVIHVRPWMEAVALVSVYLMVTGLLEVIA